MNVDAGHRGSRTLPLVGRGRDLEGLSALFGEGSVPTPFYLLTGETGIGKSRLASAMADDAERRGWQVVRGRAYPVEAGVPYAVFSDAFLPLLRAMPSSRLEVLTRGRQRDLWRLFPPLGEVEHEDEPGADPGELRTRLYWNFSKLLKGLASRKPLLVLLDDLHWAAPSSIGLLHFLVRQEDLGQLRILGTYNTDHRERSPQLIQMERSLLSLRRLRIHHLEALSADDTRELILGTFGTTGHSVDDFAHMLYGWTKGNPYFMEQTLNQLVDTGRLYQRDNTWMGWENQALALAPTVLDTVVSRLRGGGPDATTVGELLAVAGGRCPISILCDVSGGDPASVQDGVEILLELGLAEESASSGGDVSVEFRHPLLREALYHRLPLSRRARLHGAMAEALETALGGRAHEHADGLAYHFSRAGTSTHDLRAAEYLAAAGRSALQRHADREAASYLESALRIAAESDEGSPEGRLSAGRLRYDLARALGRLGRYDEAKALWTSHLEEAEDPEAIAEAHRRLALFASWSGDPSLALEHHQLAVKAVAGRAPDVEARLELGAGVALLGLGRPAEALARLERALPLAEDARDESMLARVHWALALLKTWTGDAGEAREHAWNAVSKARGTGDQLALFRARWVLAALEGLMGNTESMRDLMTSARGDAEDLGSPVLRLWVAELEVKYAWATGEWDRGISEGEAAISLARALNQRVILSRLMVWTSIIYVGRGVFDRAEALVEEAWELSGAGGTLPHSLDVHGVIPAHIGRTALKLANGDFAGAIELGEGGLAIAQRSGYKTWVLDLLPLLMEAYLRAERFSEAAAAAAGMREAAAEMDHPLARAWADACDALVGWQTEATSEDTVLGLERAAESLGKIPIRFDAARIRRQLVGRLMELDRRDQARAQLRIVWDEMSAMGAQPELQKARAMYGELDIRPPPGPVPTSRSKLTPREAELARLVAGRLKTDQIAEAMAISERTVTTHLHNIYKKLPGVGDREDLRAWVVEGNLT
ncbi:MAG: AAA family ATPase [Gemmatimonadota bacterium]|nr:AAA family ATPase [Gemmatimonadota bacterium]